MIVSKALSFTFFEKICLSGSLSPVQFSVISAFLSAREARVAFPDFTLIVEFDGIKTSLPVLYEADISAVADKLSSTLLVVG